MRLTETEVLACEGRVQKTELRVWVKEGWVRPAQGPEGPVFDDLDVARVRLVCDLRSEMSLDDEALPVVLSLIDQLHGMRRQMRGIMAALEAQPEDVRRSVLAVWREALPEDAE